GAQNGDKVRESGRKLHAGQRVDWIVEVRARHSVVVLVWVVGGDSEQGLETEVEASVVIVGGRPFVAVIFVRIETPVHVGILAVEQRRGKAANQQKLI